MKSPESIPSFPDQETGDEEKKIPKPDMNTEEENPKVNKVAKKTVSKLPDDALIESAKRAQWREERRAGQTYKESGIEE